MTPREKALELMLKFCDERSYLEARACCLITIDEILDDINGFNEYPENMPPINFWAKVRNELMEIKIL